MLTISFIFVITMIDWLIEMWQFLPLLFLSFHCCLNLFNCYLVLFFFNLYITGLLSWLQSNREYCVAMFIYCFYIYAVSMEPIHYNIAVYNVAQNLCRYQWQIIFMPFWADIIRASVFACGNDKTVQPSIFNLYTNWLKISSLLQPCIKSLLQATLTEVRP